jgi:cardiolipin synthase A/B
MSHSGFTFYTSAEYYRALTEKIAEARPGTRISLATMVFGPGEPPLARLWDELCAAAQRGVRVHVMVDSITFMILEGAVPGPLFFFSKLPKRLPGAFRKRLAALERLRAAGGTYTVTNPPNSRLANPFAGRSHIKFAVINNLVFLGGCNLGHTQNLDIMVSREDARLATWLLTFEESVAAKISVVQALDGKDTGMATGDRTRLLVDAGAPGQSHIFEHALTLIDAAKERIILTCQYFPNDVTAKHLAAAHARGVDVQIIYNHPDKHPFPLNLLHHSVVLGEKRQRPAHFFTRQLPKPTPYLHAKLLIADQTTMLGSHNYVQAGVTFGTAEIALLSTDPAFTAQALATLERQLPAAPTKR